jgi:hypothetical protein
MLQIMLQLKEVEQAEMDFLLRFPVKTGIASPVDFISMTLWGGIKVAIVICLTIVCCCFLSAICG